MAWRRHLHRHPEVSFSEHETSAWVAETLEGFGLAVERPTETSVAGAPAEPAAGADGRAAGGHRRAADPARRAASSSRPSGPGRCTRAGTTGTPRCCSARPRSSSRATSPPARCGSSSSTPRSSPPAARARWSPAGVMEGVDFVYGCHLWTPLAYGKVAAVPGPFMAAADFFTLTITRPRRARGAPPHRRRHDRLRGGAGRQPAAHRLAPDRPAGARGGHVGSLHAGDAPNVIPGEARADRHDALVRSAACAS